MHRGRARRRFQISEFGLNAAQIDFAANDDEVDAASELREESFRKFNQTALSFYFARERYQEHGVEYRGISAAGEAGQSRVTHRIG
jgi:hypothetical protein